MKGKSNTNLKTLIESQIDNKFANKLPISKWVANKITTKVQGIRKCKDLSDIQQNPEKKNKKKTDVKLK